MTAPDYLYEAGSKMRMLKLFTHLMARLNRKLLPVTVEGNVEYVVNRNRKGWVVTPINNEGVSKPPGRKEQFDPKKRIEATVTLLARAGGTAVHRVREWATDHHVKCQPTEGGARAEVVVPPGDLRILEFEVAKVTQ